VGKPRTGRKRDALGKVRESIGRRGDVLGAGPSPVGTPFGAKHAITGRKSIDVVTGRDNDASEIDPWDRRQTNCFEIALPIGHVNRIEAGRAN
jgi:hypothetical protein